MKNKQRNKLQRCSSLCCSCSRLSVSSSSENSVESSGSDRFAPISTIAHAMVQERLDQMIKERLSRYEMRKKKGRIDSSSSSSSTNCIIMVAMDKYSYNPSEDFKVSMLEVISANRINGTKELRCVLNCYLSMNSVEYRPIILQVFHEVCAELFLYRKCN